MDGIRTSEAIVQSEQKRIYRPDVFSVIWKTLVEWPVYSGLWRSKELAKNSGVVRK